MKNWIRWLAALIFGLLGTIQLVITRRFFWADELFIGVALGLATGVLPVTNYFRKKSA